MSRSSRRRQLHRRRLTARKSTAHKVLLLLIQHFLFDYCAKYDHGKQMRNKVVLRRRLDWDFHGSMLFQENQFRRYYRMHLSSFKKLLQLIAPAIVYKQPMRSRARTGIPPASPANKLQAILSWLSGGSHHHCREIAGVSAAHFYSIQYEVLDAINTNNDLALVFPATLKARKKSCSQLSKNIGVGCLQQRH